MLHSRDGKGYIPNERPQNPSAEPHQPAPSPAQGAAAWQDSIVTLAVLCHHINSHTQRTQFRTSVVDYKSTIYIINYYICNKCCAGKEAGRIEPFFWCHQLLRREGNYTKSCFHPALLSREASPPPPSHREPGTRPPTAHY